MLFSLKCNEKLILLASDISNDVGKVHEHLCARIRKVGRAAGVALPPKWGVRVTLTVKNVIFDSLVLLVLECSFVTFGESHNSWDLF